MARLPYGSGRLCTDLAGVLSGLQHRRRALRLCRRPGVALRRLAIADDGGALAARRSDRARLVEHVSPDGHAVLARFWSACARRGAARGLARPGDPAARVRPAGILFRRHGMARRPVRRRLARRPGAGLGGARSAPRGGGCLSRRWRCSWSRSACCCGRMRFSPRRFSPPMSSGPCASMSGAWPSSFCLPSSCSMRLSRSSITAFSTPSGKIRCTRSWFSISAASLTSAGENQFPVTWSADQTALLTSRCYDPVRWDSYWHVPPCPFVMQRLERPDDAVFGTPRLVAAWWKALSAHPLAYLSHRATFMWQFLARSNLVLPVWDWLDPASSYGHSRYFTPLVSLHDMLQPTLLFRPGLWLVLAMVIGALAWRTRSTPAGAFAVSVTRLRDRLCHDLLRSRCGGRFPLRLLVRSRHACRRRGGCSRPLRTTRRTLKSSGADSPADAGARRAPPRRRCR